MGRPRRDGRLWKRFEFRRGGAMRTWAGLRLGTESPLGYGHCSTQVWLWRASNSVISTQTNVKQSRPPADGRLAVRLVGASLRSCCDRAGLF